MDFGQDFKISKADVEKNLAASLAGLPENDLRRRIEERVRNSSMTNGKSENTDGDGKMEKKSGELSAEKIIRDGKKKKEAKKKKKKKERESKGGDSTEPEKKKRHKEKSKKKKKRKEKEEKSEECGQLVNSVVVAVSTPPALKPSRWEIDEDETERFPSIDQSVAPKLSSAVVRPPKRHRSPISHRSLSQSRSGHYHDYSRHSLPPKHGYSSHRPRHERERYSLKPRRNFTGYDEFRHRSPSPNRLSFDEENLLATRPSPPKDMPEHIRWLHERWNKYDRSFFSGTGTKEATTTSGKKEDSTPNETTTDSVVSISLPSQPSTSKSGHDRRQPDSPSSSRRDSRGRRDRERTEGHYSLPYYQFRKGGVFQSFSGIGQPLMTLKEFIVTQPGDLANDQDEALRLFEEYKMEYKRRMYADFFQTHQENEWFLEKYHPIYKAEKDARRRMAIKKRLDVFMQLLVRGWMETRLDVDESRKTRKLLDACLVLLEGGDESDLGGLSDLDYVLEEKKEEAVELERLRVETEAREAAEAAAAAAEEEDEDEDADGKKKKKQKRCADDESDEEGKKHDSVELEIMQHAKDYSLYVQEHLQEQNVDISDQPDLLNVVKTKTKYVGDGMFVQELVAPSAGTLDETTLHKASAVVIKNIPPFAKREELERICSESHGGYLRLFISEPDPQLSFSRYAVASFWSNANLQKVCWAMRGAKLGAFQLSVAEFRDFGQKRIAFVDGLAADKSVVLRDIQLCKSLIEYLDKKNRLWESVESEGQPPITNPLLVNLDECLAFHLQQLIESGRLGQKNAANSVDRDPNLTKILDRLILYLRVVHSIDYYGCRFYETEDDEPKRIGLMHIRGPEAVSRAATSRNLTTYIREFEARLKDIMPQEARLSEEHVELLGRRNVNDEIEKYVGANIVAAEEKGMAQCCMCLKRFTSEEFARTHIFEKHDERFDEIKWIVLCFNNYLSDPNRPCNSVVSSTV